MSYIAIEIDQRSIYEVMRMPDNAHGLAPKRTVNMIARPGTPSFIQVLMFLL